MKKGFKNINKQLEKKIPITKTKLAFWEKRFFFEILIFCFSFLLFANSISNDYNLDDELVTINHRLTSKGISAIPEIFTSPYYKDDAGYSYEYRPIVLVSFAIEHDFFGENPHWGHFWNVMLYGLSCVLLYKVLQLLFKSYSPLIAIAVSLLFVSHPAHTEVVCSIKNRDEILGLFFSLLTFYIVLKFILTEKSYLLILIPLFFMLALMSKITVVSFVVIIPIALILLFNASFLVSIFVTFLMLLPTFFLMSYGTTFDKIILCIFILVGVALFCFLVHLKETYQVLKFLLKSGYQNVFFIQKSEVVERTTEVSFFSWVGRLPTRAILSFPAILLSIILCFAYYWCITNNLFTIAIIFILVLILLVWKSNATYSWWGSLVLNICIILNLILFRIELSFYRDLIIFYLISLIYFRRDLSIQAALFLVLVGILNAILMHNFSIVFYAPFFLLILNLKIRRYLLYGLSFGFLLTILFFTKWTSLDGWSISFSLLLCLLTVIVFDSYKGVLRSVYVGYIVSLFLLFGIIESNQHHKSTSVLPQMNATISSINAINVTYQKAKQYRPINFVEQCVDNNSDNVIRMGTSLEVLFHYLHKVILPYPLSYYYGFQFISPKSIFSILPIVSLLLHLGLLFLFVYCSHRNKILSFGILVYLVSILIFSGYFQPIPGMIGDRYLLIPSLGWAIIVIIVFLSLFKNIFSISDVWERKGTIVRYSFLGLLLIYSVISFSRNRNWNNHLTLYRHDIVYVANSAHAHNLLALRLMKESFEAKDVNNQLSLRREASEHFRKAIAIYPEFFNANYDLARTYYLLNMPDSAIFYFSKTFKLNPEFSDAPLAAGNILLENERYSEAKPFFELIVLHRPNVYVGYEKLNYIFFKQNDYQKAIAINKDAIFKIPNIIQPYISIAKIYHSIGKDDSTRFWLQKGLQLSPNDDEATKLLQSLNK